MWKPRRKRKTKVVHQVTRRDLLVRVVTEKIKKMPSYLRSVEVKKETRKLIKKDTDCFFLKAFDDLQSEEQEQVLDEAIAISRVA